MSENATPAIEALAPAAAKGGELVEIRGSGFGKDRGAVSLRLLDADPERTEVSAWTDTAVTAKVPPFEHFGSGGPLELILETAGGAIATASFMLLDSAAPVIADITPPGGEVEGRQISVRGPRFGRPGAGQRLLLGDQSLATTAWTPNEVAATLPSGIGVGGAKALTLETPWGTSAPIEYTVHELPRIASLAPQDAKPDTPIEVRGSAFGARRGTVLLRVPGESPVTATAAVDGWTDSALTIRVRDVDELAGGGPLEVIVHSAVGASAPAPMMLLELERPSTVLILPEDGQAEHGEITVTGTGFGRQNVRSALVIAAANVPGEVLEWSRTLLRLRVPSARALGGPGVKQVRVSTPWGDSDPRDYEVGQLPVINALSNEHVPPGAEISLHGEAFGPRPPGRVQLVTTYAEDGGAPPTIETIELEPLGEHGWQDDRIRVKLPRFEQMRTSGPKELVVTSRWGEGRKAITISGRGSITAYTRLEPHARTQNLEAGLATGLEARVYDALWLLARQDQLLELRATDGGSPVEVRVEGETAQLSRWRSGTSASQPLPALHSVPIEAVIERERVTAPAADSEGGFGSRRLAVEAGLQFLRNLDARLRDPGKSDDYRKRFVDAYPVPAPTDADRTALDPETFRFLSVMDNRVPDGDLLRRALYVALPPERGGEDRLPGRPPIGGNDRASVRLAILDWFDWCEALFSQGDPTTHPWIPERLEYDVAVSGRLGDQPGAGEVVLEAREYDGRRLDWYSFVRLGAEATLLDGGGEPHAAAQPIVRTVMPTTVTFPGAPVQRWWELEGPVNFGAIAAGPTDLIRLFFIHFATVFSGDWFWAPIDDVPAGSLCRVQRLIVTDSFGDETVVDPFTGGDAGDWRMFELSRADGLASPGLLFLPGALPSTLESLPLEDVRFFRDELANLAWAVEHTIHGPMERPLNRHEALAHARREAEIAGGMAPQPSPQAPPLVYSLATSVPENWFPLIPVVEPADRRLVCGAIQRADSDDTIQPQGELLEPGLRLYDEEVPRTGARVTRLWQLGRAPNGETHLWLARRREIGRGEGSSGLRFDAVQRPPRA